MTDNLKHKIIKYLNSEYSNLEQFEPKEWTTDYIFFMKDGKVIFEYDKKNEFVYISYNKIWAILESFFGLEYEKIRHLIKEWVEGHYNLRVTTTATRSLALTNLVEGHYKLKTNE